MIPGTAVEFWKHAESVLDVHRERGVVVQLQSVEEGAIDRWITTHPSVPRTRLCEPLADCAT